jgi:hypothetical protein
MLFSSSRKTHHQPSEEKKERLIFNMEPEAAVGSSVFGLKRISLGRQLGRCMF